MKRKKKLKVSGEAKGKRGRNCYLCRKRHNADLVKKTYVDVAQLRDQVMPELQAKSIRNKEKENAGNRQGPK